MERTFVMIKPDGVAKGLTDEVISRLEKSGLKVVSKRRLRLNRSLAEKLYAVHREKEFFEGLVVHVLSGEIVAMMVEGENAISRARQIIGPTDPKKAPSGTIRGDFGPSVIYTKITQNVIHASDSPENAKKELLLFFKNNA